MDHLFTQLMLHLSHVKQMCSQSIHLTHELILRIQITRGRVDFIRDFAVKSPCRPRLFNLRPSNPDLLCLADVPSLKGLATFMAPHGRAPSLIFSICSQLNFRSLELSTGDRVGEIDTVQMRLDQHALLLMLTFSHQESRGSILI